MSKKANPTLIGAFTVGAIAIAVAAVLLFGSGKFFKTTQTFAVFFDGSVKGLDVGAPVKFRGVKIGSVSDIILIADAEKELYTIEVLVEIDKEKTKGPEKLTATSELYQKLLGLGMRAQLGLDSVVTGKLFVSLDLFPDTPANLTGLDKKYVEIPSIPTGMERLQETLKEVMNRIGELPLEEIVENLNETLEGIDELVNAEETRESIRSFSAALAELREVVTKVNQELPPFTDKADKTLDEAREMVSDLDAQIPSLTSSIEEASRAAQETLEQATKTLAMIENATNERSPLRTDLRQLLEELARAARAIRLLGEYLEQHPESIIQGKPGSGGK